MRVGLALPGLIDPALEDRERLGLGDIVHYRFRRLSGPFNIARRKPMWYRSPQETDSKRIKQARKCRLPRHCAFWAGRKAIDGEIECEIQTAIQNLSRLVAGDCQLDPRSVLCRQLSG